MRQLHQQVLVVLVVLANMVSSEAVTLGKGGPAEISLDLTTGSMMLSVGGTPWAESSNVAFHANQTWYTSASSLKLYSTVPITGTHPRLGKFTGYELQWATDGSPHPVMVASIKYHTAMEAFVFEQRFPNGITGAATGTDAEPWSCFPSLHTSSHKMSELGYLTQHHMFGGGVHGVGLAGYPGDIQGGSPLILFDLEPVNHPGNISEKANTAVISPLINFKTSVQAVSQAGPCAGSWAAGLNGLIDVAAAAETVHSTVLLAGHGIHNTTKKWGDLLLRLGDKNPTKNLQHVTSTKLSYWTDNGAWNYYHADAPNYQDTMEKIHKSMAENRIPVKSYQLDSWWYYKYEEFDGGLLKWEPRKERVFPHGIEAVQDILKSPLTLHNRWFSSHNDYMDKFPFTTEGEWAFPSGGLANVTALYEFTDSWGMAVYEQDWLKNSFTSNTVARSDPHAANNWLFGMGAAASKKNIIVQYCMPLPSDYHISTQIVSVAQIRVSDDYAVTPNQWQIGTSSIFAWAVGLSPFKDVFWTTQHQPGNFYFRQEPNPLLQMIVATMSTGPVAIGDRIGHTNATLVNMACMPDGTILKPSRPFLSIESMFSPSGPKGELWSTFTNVSGSRAMHFVLSAGLVSDFTITPAHLGIYSGDFDICTWSGGTITAAMCKPFNRSNDFSVPASPPPVNPLNEPRPFHYYLVTPWIKVGDNRFQLLGEVDKIAAVSEQRFKSITAASGAIVLNLRGTDNETVSIHYRTDRGAEFRQVTCQTGTACQLKSL